MRPPIELRKTMRPRAARIIGSIRWVTSSWPLRLTSTWRRKSSIGIVSSGLGSETPALLTRPSRPASPRSAAIVSAVAAICSASVTSSGTGASRSDPSRRSDSASGSRRTPAKTCQPAASRRSAVARPIPVEAPVTRTDRIGPGYRRAVGRNLDRAVIDEAERKQVTVLFADVMGSMDLAEQHDPEEWRKLMQRFFSILAGAVEEFEGTVDKFTGDGIMAVFGAPVADEDHARHACYAALKML